MQSPEDPGRTRRSRWVPLIIGLGIALLLGEGLARLRYAHPPLPPDEYDTAPMGMFENDPSTGFRLAPDFSDEADHFSTNGMGFRDRPRAPGAPQPGVTRIALIGDSFAAGVGVADDEHLSLLLEDASRAAGLPVEVWNLGVPHFGTQQASLQLAEQWDAVRPTIVVLALFQGNDVYDDIQGPSFYRVRHQRITRRGWAPWPGDPHNDVRAELNRPLLAHHLPLDGVLQRHSSLYRLTMRGVHALRYGPAAPWPWDMRPFDYEAFGGIPWLYLVPAPSPMDAGWRITGEALASLRDLVRGNGAQFAVLAVPSKIEVTPADLRFALEEGWESKTDSARAFDVALPARRVIELTAALDIPRIDMLPALSEAAVEERVYYTDDSHWNAAGHRVAAEVLGGGLASLGWIPEVQGLRGVLQGAVPIGSAPEVYLGGFREDPGGPGPVE